MDEKIYSYYTQSSIEQFRFYQFPKMLLFSRHASGLSSDAKVLYVVMRDRLSLSLNHDFFYDDNGHAFIFFSLEEAAALLDCHINSASKVMNELIQYGLISKRRSGQGKPSKIYVYDFFISEQQSSKNIINKNETDSANENFSDASFDIDSSTEDDKKNQEERKISDTRYGTGIHGYDSRFTNIVNQDSQILGIKTHKYCESRLTNIVNQDSQILGVSNTNINNTDINNTESSSLKKAQGDIKRDGDDIFRRETSDDEEEIKKLIGFEEACSVIDPAIVSMLFRSIISRGLGRAKSISRSAFIDLCSSLKNINFEEQIINPNKYIETCVNNMFKKVSKNSSGESRYSGSHTEIDKKNRFNNFKLQQNYDFDEIYKMISENQLNTESFQESEPQVSLDNDKKTEQNRKEVGYGHIAG